MKNKNTYTPLLKSNIATLALLQLLLAAVSILSGYYYSNRILLGMDEKIQNQLYASAGGEENYKLLQELQKSQVETYISDYSKQNPEQIQAIKRKIATKETATNGISYGALTQEEYDALQGSSFSGSRNSSGSHLLVEFTQIGCEHCKELQNSPILSSIESSFSGGIQTIKKLLVQKNSPHTLAGEKLKCIGKVYGDIAYQKSLFSSIEQIPTESSLFDGIFSEQKNIILDFEKEYNSKKEYTSCLTSHEGKKLLEQDLGHGMYLGIRTTPTLYFVRKSDKQFVRIDGLQDVTIYQSEVEKLK